MSTSDSDLSDDNSEDDDDDNDNDVDDDDEGEEDQIRSRRTNATPKRHVIFQAFYLFIFSYFYSYFRMS